MTRIKIKSTPFKKKILGIKPTSTYIYMHTPDTNLGETVYTAVAKLGNAKLAGSVYTAVAKLGVAVYTGVAKLGKAKLGVANITNTSKKFIAGAGESAGYN